MPPDSRNVGTTLLQTAALTKYNCEDVYAWNGKNNIGETPHLNNGWDTTKPNNNSNNRDVNTVSTSSSTTTVKINGTIYQIKGSGSTSFTVNGATVTVITQ